MHWVSVIALIAAGILALSSFIIAQKPQAKELIDKMVPFQGFLGVALLVWGIVDAIWVFSHLEALTAKGVPMSITIANLTTVAAELGLGFLFGMPLVAKWIPGDSPAEQKAMEMQKKLVPYQTILGALALVAAILLIYISVKYKFHH